MVKVKATPRGTDAMFKAGIAAARRSFLGSRRAKRSSEDALERAEEAAQRAMKLHNACSRIPAAKLEALGVEAAFQGLVQSAPG